MDWIYSNLMFFGIVIPLIIFLWYFGIKRKTKQSHFLILAGISFLLMSLVDLIHNFFHCDKIVFLGSASSCSYSHLFGSIYWREIWELGFFIFGVIAIASFGMFLWYNYIYEDKKQLKEVKNE